MTPATDVRRRSVLVAGAAGSSALLLSGCRLNNPFDGEKTPAGDAVPRLDPDIAVAVQAVAAIDVARRLVEATGRRHPALVAELHALLSLNRSHRAALVQAVPHDVELHQGGTAPLVAPGRAAARGAVLEAEDRLRSQLRGFAMRAESGPFARLLAAMDAAVGQQLSVQPGHGQGRPS